MNPSAQAVAFDPALFQALLSQHQQALAPGQRWLLLEAMHVVGQTRLVPHWISHWRMLAQARQDGDWAELFGQLMRLALVPLGHTLGRLPLGNPGRANVSAFAPMVVREDIARAIAQARAGVVGAGRPPAA
jgi:hypothetical protein